MRRAIAVLIACAGFLWTTTSAMATSLSPLDWSNAVTISQSGTVTTGDLVGLWQAVLAVRAELPTKCYQDGSFGSATTTGTQTYQTRFSIAGGPDGVVGSATWSHANSGTTALQYVGSSSTTGYQLYRYVGDSSRTFYLIYGTTSTQWGFRPYGFASAPDRPSYWSTDHPTVTFSAPPGC
jgi:hypothetical protein